MSLIIKVLTYNIHHGADAHEIVNLKRTGEVIKKSGAHLAALQEVDFLMPRSFFSLQARRLGKILHMNYMFGTNMIWSGLFRYGNAILSRYPVIESVNIPLPYVAEKRGLLKALIRVNNHTQFYLLCAHLGLSAPERRVQTEIILETIQELNTPCILAGDFNCGPDAPELDCLKECLMDTAAKKLGAYVTFPSYRPQFCLDYIMATREWRVKSAGIPISEASDHLPLLVELELSQS